MNDREIRIIDNNIELVSRILNACVRIRCGEAKVSVLRDLRLNEQIFRILNDYASSLEASPDNDTGMSTSKLYPLPTLNPSERLYGAIFGEPVLSRIPSDVEETVGVALKLLNDRERKVIRMLYWENLTIQECAKNMQYTPDGVQKIKSRALNKLRKPAVRTYLMYGEAHYKSERIKRLNDEVAMEQEAVIELENKTEELKKRYHRLTQYAIVLSSSTEIESIECLKLPKKAEMCLKREGIYTIKDLEGRSRREIGKIRNFGSRSMELLEKNYHMLTGKTLFSA